MSYFLAKTDPFSYSIEDLQKEGKTVWDGVRNPQAVQAIKQMKPGDTLLVYHSQGQSAIVGLAKILSEARPDPNEPKSWVVDVEFLKKLETPVTLSEIKASGLFENFSLVKQGRLSTMTVPADFIDWLQQKVSLSGLV